MGDRSRSGSGPGAAGRPSGCGAGSAATAAAAAGGAPESTAAGASASVEGPGKAPRHPSRMVQWHGRVGLGGRQGQGQVRYGRLGAALPRVDARVVRTPDTRADAARGRRAPRTGPSGGAPAGPSPERT